MWPDDEDYPLLEWAADRAVFPDLRCTLCWGSGLDGDLPCRCLADACFTRFAAAADDADPVPRCPRCGGEGEDFDGRQCLCLLAGLRLIEDQREPELAQERITDDG